jgi:hypothetical protein
MNELAVIRSIPRCVVEPLPQKFLTDTTTVTSKTDAQASLPLPGSS